MSTTNLRQPMLRAREATNGRTASILVVDDVPANLQVLTEMSRTAGTRFDPFPIGNWLGAVRTPDLILLDINMPEMGGYEVCQHLKDDEFLRGSRHIHQRFE